MPDGTVLAGISPDTNKPMYATPTDASLAMTFNEAQDYATKLDVHGHKDWRVPAAHDRSSGPSGSSLQSLTANWQRATSSGFLSEVVGCIALQR